MLPYIIGGEILFWALLLGGLSVRYFLGGRVASTVLLVATPVVDIGIIVLTYVDLAGNSSSDFSHGLAAFYVGFSIVFGPEVIGRLDRRFARRYSELRRDQLPSVPERSSLAYWYRCLLASAITAGLLAVGIVVASWTDSFWLIYWVIVVGSTVVTWAIFGPVRDDLRAHRHHRSADS